MSAARNSGLPAVTFVLLLAFAIAGVAGGAKGGKADKVPPSTPTNVRVESASTTSVSVRWDASTDDKTGVAGYYVFVNGQRARVESTAYTARDLPCGEGVGVQVVAYDRVNNRSETAGTIVSTAPCPDVQPPSIPEGFVQAATTQDAIVLNWKPSTDNIGVVGYGVYRNLARVASPAEPTVTLSGLACGVTYAYQVDAVDAAGNRSHFATAYIETSSCGDSRPPSAPTDLAATSRTATTISVAWSPAIDDVAVAGYDVTVAGRPAASVTQTSATLSALTCDTTYAIAVRAFDAAGNRSPASTIDSATGPCASPSPTPPADTTAPSAPTGLAASNVSQTSLTLSWSPSSDNVGVTAYDVTRNGTKTATVSSTSSNQTGLTCGTSYAFAVVARDAAGNSSQATQLNVSTAACSSPSSPTDTTPPSQPANLGISSATRTSVTLAWGASSDNVGVAGYRTYVNGSPGSTTSQLTATVSGLVCGTAYTLAVDAYDAAGNRSTKASVIGSTAACADVQPPTAPANVVATSRTATSIALSWSASSDNVGVTGYGLYRAGTRVGTSSGTTGIFSGLTCNTNYTLGVDAYDAAGNRSSQTLVMVSTTACADTSPPSAPTGLAASSITQTSLTLTWNASADNLGVAGYDVFRAGTKTATVTSTSSAQSGLACGTSYTLGVVAFDAAGNRSPQAAVSATTSVCSVPAPAPTPPPSDAYFVNDYSTQDFRTPWTTLFSHTSPGWVDVSGAPTRTTPDGRVAVASDPDGSGYAARMEMRDSDPGWASSPTLQKSEVRTVTQQTMNKSTLSVGDVRWFSTRIWLPDNAQERFEWPTSGADTFFTILGIHPGSSSMGGATSIEWYAGSKWVTFRLNGGTPPGGATESVPLWRLLNDDGSRYAPSYNRWIDLVFGVRFAPDSTGWFEAWVDGVNVYPRKNRPTMWAGDTTPYFKYGLYKQKSSSFPSGKSVIYFGRTTIGYSKP